jgi:glycosyltransferase involved in cell wall biosynthesis
MNKHKPNIGILTFPVSRSGVIPLSNLISIILDNSYKVYLITGNEGYDRFKNNNKVQGCYGVNHKSGNSGISRVTKYLVTQLKIAYGLLKLNRKVDTWLFFIGADGLIIPMLLAKLYRKNVVFIRAGSSLESLSDTRDKGFRKPVSWITKINLYLSDRIVVYSSIFIKHWNLEKHNEKLIVCSEHFININDFKVTKGINERQKIVGYIGRLSDEKGVFNFIEAIPLIIKSNIKLNVIIGGDGTLRPKIETYLNEKNLNKTVKQIGWIPHDKLPRYLNELKLLVLPSYTEGLPNIMLEAMACGTPVLATSVGAIPDVIRDGETGFILENNSPEFIAEYVFKILNMPDDKLEKVSEKARKIVEEEFTFNNTVERWGDVLQII